MKDHTAKQLWYLFPNGVCLWVIWTLARRRIEELATRLGIELIWLQRSWQATKSSLTGTHTCQIVPGNINNVALSVSSTVSRNPSFWGGLEAWSLGSFENCSPKKNSKLEKQSLQCYAQQCRYRGGIWLDNSNSTIEDIDHDVEVVGWGEENGQKFWRVRNSWGTFWGEVGFFRVDRGTDALFMENGDCW